MQNYPGYASPFAAAPGTNYAYIVAGIVFYLFVAFSAFYSVATVLILIRHAQSKVTALGASFVYAIIYLSLIGQGVGYLNLLK